MTTRFPFSDAETRIKNGSWTVNTRKQHPHITLPEIRLRIPNSDFFRHACPYLSFMTVFSTRGISDTQVQRQSRRDWTSKSEENVLMRTAGFGYGLANLQACAKMLDYSVKGKDERGEMRPWMADEVVVPLAVSRRQMKSDGRLVKQRCKWWGGGRGLLFKPILYDERKLIKISTSQKPCKSINVWSKRDHLKRVNKDEANKEKKKADT
jgi:hypothetical protein